MILIEQDAPTRATVKALFGQFPEVEYSEYDNGMHGWTACLTTKPLFDLVICGWTMPELGGLALLNRMRQDPVYAGVPLLVISDVVKRKDFRVLEEFPVTALLEKPLSEARLVKSLEDLIAEKYWIDLNSADIKRLFREAREDGADLKASLRQLLKEAPNPLPIGLLVADSLVARNALMQAESLYKALLVKDPGNLRALNGVGRVLFDLGKTDEAASYLRVAWRDCQLNITRLCLLGKIDLVNLDPEAARKHFNSALAIDEENAEAKAGIEMSDSLADHIRLNAGAKLPRSLASLANMLAITQVWEGHIDEGIAQYRAALHLLTDPVTSAKVMFNLGLAYLRGGKPEAALPWFEASVTKGGDAFTKARPYKERYGVTKEVESVKPPPPISDEQLDAELEAFESEVIGQTTTPKADAGDLEALDLEVAFEDETF